MKKLGLIILAAVLVATIILSACSPAPPPPAPPQPAQQAPSARTDPGVPRPPSGAPAPSLPGGGAAPYVPPAPGRQPPQDTIGFAAGGAKDIGNFRENIRNNYLPLPTDVTYEGLFYDYFFDTGATRPTNKLFAPSYSYAVTRDPFSGQPEYYLAVGLNSGMKDRDFGRKKLNLVIVLDNSGSMSQSFNQYYYDRFGARIDAYAEEGIMRGSKMESANESVRAILDQLGPEDRFAIVLFNSGASLFRSMGPVRGANMRSISNSVSNILAGGGTNMMAGLQMGTDQFSRWELNDYEYENRIIFLTDAQPNTGDTSPAGLLGVARRNADRRIYTTFIGIGVDFNSELIEDITKIKGANYYSVHSPKQFRNRVREEFDFMVTPLVFNLRMKFESRGWQIEKVFGSPEASEATGELMKINTLFPSKREGGETRGGLVLLKLRKTSPEPGEQVYLRVSYEDRDGRRDSGEEVIYLDRETPEYFGNSGIRKGILLTRYASLLRNWMIDERQYRQTGGSWTASVRDDTGIVIPVHAQVSRWERQSIKLTVSEPYGRLFRQFSRYFENEMRAVNDRALDQELRILDQLGRYRN
ncbi:MAG: VWA domain-containing protein [Chloroflexi bacterium]|nr:VWA domain-containing protein [Chloroflexota bacterium]